MSEETSIGLPLRMGVDIGTTSVKICVVDTQKNQILHSVQEETQAELKSDTAGSLGYEQDPLKILSAVQKCVEQLPKEDIGRVSSVGVTGQMHGVVLWKSTQWGSYGQGKFTLDKTSRLFTWQDQRCTEEFLASLPRPDSHLCVSTGFGCATLCWLSAYQPRLLDKALYDCAGNISDFVVAILCKLNRPVMSTQIAASWGYFNTQTKSWNKEKLEGIGFPVHLLPEVVTSGQVAGTVQFDWFGFKPGTPVMAALGDVQCAVLSMVEPSGDAVLNLSTSGQLCLPIHQPDFVPQITSGPTPPLQYFPYFNDGYMAVAASLNGGNVLEAFVHMLQQWMMTFGCDVSREQIWQKLSTAGENDKESDLIIMPTLFGERHLPSEFGKIMNIKDNNLGLGPVFRSLCRGLIVNLHKMMPLSFLEQFGVKRLLCTGSVVTRNGIIRQEIETIFSDISVVYRHACDSAYGAAMATLKCNQSPHAS